MAGRRVALVHPGGQPGAHRSRGGYRPHPEIAPRTELIGFDVISMGWRLLYLAGVGGLAATLAIASRRVTPATVIAATAALAAAIADGLVQLR